MKHPIILFGLLLMSAGVLLAQTETPTPDPSIPTPTVRPVELACDLDALLDEQGALASQLDRFQEEAGNNSGLALDNLFRVDPFSISTSELLAGGIFRGSVPSSERLVQVPT